MSVAAPFSKIFPFLQRFHFPPFGYALNPREVSEEVALVHEIFRADVKHQIVLRSSNASAAGAGADVNLNLLENPRSHNYLSIPIYMAIGCFGAAGTQNVQIQTVNSGDPNVPELPFGSWPIQTNILTMRINDGVAEGFSRFQPVPMSMPMMKGVHLGANFVLLPIGRTAAIRSFWVEVPIECFDWAQIAVLPASLRTFGEAP